MGSCGGAGRVVTACGMDGAGEGSEEGGMRRVVSLESGARGDVGAGEGPAWWGSSGGAEGGAGVA